MPESNYKMPGHQRLSLAQLLVGVILVLWNGFGLAIAISVQTGQIPLLDPVSQDYFESQPLWFVLFADLGPVCGLAGAVALLLQHRVAVWLFAANFAILALSNIYKFALGRSLIQLADAPIGPTLFAFAILAAQAFYASWLEKRGRLY